MKRRCYRAAAIVVVFAVLLAGCGSTASDTDASGTTAAAPPGFPLTITNCGQSMTLERPPTRAASMDQISTELMLHLGLEGALVGTASRSGDVFDGGAGFTSLTAAYAKIPVLAELYPSQEVLLNASPDFVTGNSDLYTFGPTTEGGTGFTRADMASKSIGTYTFLCKGEKATNDLLFGRYEEFGTIFGKGNEAKAFVAKIRDSLAASTAVLAGATPVRTFYYESGTGPLKTYGGGGQFDNGLLQSGGKGIFDDVPSFPTPTVGTEQVVDRNPDAIVIVDAGVFGKNDPDPAAKKAFLVSTLGPSVNAVKNDRFCYLDFGDFATGPRSATSVASLGACLHPELKFG